MMRRGGGLLIFINGEGIVLNYVDATRLAQAENFFQSQYFNNVNTFYSEKYTYRKRIYGALTWCPKFINQALMERYVVI